MPQNCHRIMCENAQDLAEIESGIGSEIDERHDEILGANTPWEPVFSSSPILGLDDTVIMDDEFHLPIEVD